MKYLVVVLGGGNSKQYCEYDGQLAITTMWQSDLKANVYGAVGGTKPVHETTERLSDCDWILTDECGNQTSTGSNKIDLTNP